MNRQPRASCLLLLVAVLLGGCRLSYTGGAKPVTPTDLEGEWLRAAATPVVKQQAQSDCGLAALAMVAGAWGKQWSVDDLARHVQRTANGVKLAALRDLARTRGLDAYAIAGTHDDLRHELANGRPVLLGLRLPFERDRALDHYEVAVAMNPRDGSVVTLDPATGKHLRRTRQVLEAEWKPGGYPTLVVVGERSPAGDNRALSPGRAVERRATP